MGSEAKHRISQKSVLMHRQEVAQHGVLTAETAEQLAGVVLGLSEEIERRPAEG